MTAVRVYNAAGPRSKSPKDLRTLLATPVPVITIGSVSLAASTGNKAKKYWVDPASGTSLNSMGLPNKGIAYYERLLPTFIKDAHAAGKKVRVSIVGSRTSEYVELVRRLRKLDIDQIEVNTSCPNVWNGTKQKRIASFDLDLLEKLVSATLKVAKGLPLDYKLSPYSDPEMLRKVALLLRRHAGIRAVVTANTFPNAYSALTGLAGMGGDGYRHIVLGQVKQFRQVLPARIKIVALGGASSKKHVADYVAAGAAEVQVGTHYFKNGPGVFKKL